MNRRSVFRKAILTAALLSFGLALGSVPARASSSPHLPQGLQSDASFAASYASNHVTNVVATTQQVSCYRPEVPYAVNLGPTDGYTGESACNGAANTGEDIGTSPYPTQLGSKPGYPANAPMLVKDHSESDIRVDPTNPNHIIGQSKWFVSAEGYNHLLGFYESFDGGKTFPLQGHVPGYEGWTDDTDPVGAFDGFGDFYSLLLPYQFSYYNNGNHNVSNGNIPNPNLPGEVIAAAVRPAGSTDLTQWQVMHNGHLDYLMTAPNAVANDPDKQWIAIDTNPASPHYNRIYAMWTLFHFNPSLVFYSYADALPKGEHTDWSTPRTLPTINGHPWDTYLLPHIAPDGTVYTTLTNNSPKQGFTFATLYIVFSRDGAVTWQGPLPVVQNIVVPTYKNTTFREGIVNTFAVGNVKVNGNYPVYASWEDGSSGVSNLYLSASYDNGSTWTTPIRVNDNVSAVDELQPNLNVAPNGTVSVAFYDRRLTCPASGTSEAAGAGLALDTTNPNYSGALPPYGATNYCVNSAIQFYSPTLQPIGQNIRMSQHTWDPQLNSPHPFGILNRTTFIGDYFGNTSNGPYEFITSVSTFNAGSNPSFYQQQVVASVQVP